MKGAPLIFIMFAVVILCASIVGISSYFGEADWTWIANQIIPFVIVFMAFGSAIYVLMEWIKR